MNTMLDRHRGSKNIGSISGTCFSSSMQYGRVDSYFSKVCQVWGWATWRDKWMLLDLEMKNFEQVTYASLGDLGYSLRFRNYWCSRFSEVANQGLDTWDYSWIYTHIKHDLMSCMPPISLCRNKGFGESATHTFTGSDKIDNEGKLIKLAGRRDSRALLNVSIDEKVFRERFSGDWFSTLLRRFSQLKRMDPKETRWSPVDIKETDYIDSFQIENLSYKLLCQELNRVWRQLGCCNRLELIKQKDKIDRFYRHPVWRLNSLYSQTDPISKSIRSSIVRKIKDLDIDTVIDFGGGDGHLASLIRSKAGVKAFVFDPYQNERDLSIDQKELNGAQFDGLVCLDVLEHTDNPMNLIKQMAGMVRLDGYLIIGSCFYPVIDCHIPRSFYMRHIFSIVAFLFGFNYIGRVAGAEYVHVYRKVSEKGMPSKVFRTGLKVLGYTLNQAEKIMRIIGLKYFIKRLFTRQ